MLFISPHLVSNCTFLLEDKEKRGFFSFTGVTQNIIYQQCLNSSDSHWPGKIKRTTCFRAKNPIFSCCNKWLCSRQPFIQIEKSRKEKQAWKQLISPLGLIQRRLPVHCSLTFPLINSNAVLLPKNVITCQLLYHLSYSHAHMVLLSFFFLQERVEQREAFPSESPRPDQSHIFWSHDGRGEVYFPGGREITGSALKQK